MSSLDRTLTGEEWKLKMRGSVIMSMDDWVKLNSWIKSTCRQTVSACLDMK